MQIFTYKCLYEVKVLSIIMICALPQGKISTPAWCIPTPAFLRFFLLPLLYSSFFVLLVNIYHHTHWLRPPSFFPGLSSFILHIWFCLINFALPFSWSQWACRFDPFIAIAIAISDCLPGAPKHPLLANIYISYSIYL